MREEMLDDSPPPDAGPLIAAARDGAAPGREPRFVVGIGASAGGLEALEALLREMPANTGMAFVVVQHLSPDHKSHMTELLSKHTAMPVHQATDGLQLAPDAVYLIPPKKVMTLHAGALRLSDRPSGLNLPIDIFFGSLAEQIGDAAVGVILSGTGSDGMRGVRAIKGMGGLVMVQDPSTAKFDGMPRAAISIGLADYVLPVEAMPSKLSQHTVQFETLRVHPIPAAESTEDAFARLMSLLRKQTGVDFSKYKASTLGRRLHRRMAVNHLGSLDEYLQLAQRSPVEVAALFKELLISVTKFFRDTDSFATLRREIIPALIEDTGPNDSLRVWVAGCATGEEAYSLAILFEEAFDLGARPRDVKIFATDIDRDALELAGAGVYPDSIAADISPERLSRFFVRRGDTFQIARFVRQRVVFANHDVTRDPPFSRVSLISCRNLLIYFTQALQQQVMASLRFALRPGGFLFLGGSETISDAGDGFTVEHASAKLFRRTGAAARFPGLGHGNLTRTGRAETGRVGGVEAGASTSTTVQSAYDALIQAYVPPTALLNDRGDIVHLFGPPSPLLQLTAGAATLNLLHLLPPALASVTGLALHRALRDGGEAEYRSVPTDAGPVTVTVRPVAGDARARHALVTLAVADVRGADTGAAHTMAVDAQQQIADLQQELAYSRENLQATIEELETSNEELQATNEELVASNEELQSTNEELQSVNEELHTLNAEYQAKIAELVRLNDDIDNLLRSARIGIVFLDAELAVTRFTPAISEVMNLLDRDLGRPITDISLRFEAPWFAETLRDVARSRRVLDHEIALGDGRLFLIRVEPYVSEWAREGGLVITALDVTVVKQAEQRLACVLDALPQQVALLDRDGTITLVNRSWRAFAIANGARDDDTTCIGANYLDVCGRAEHIAPEAARTMAQLSALLAGTVASVELEYPCHSPIEERWFLMQATPLGGGSGGAVVSHVNITARKRLEISLAAKLAAPRDGASA